MGIGGGARGVAIFAAHQSNQPSLSDRLEDGAEQLPARPRRRQTAPGEVVDGQLELALLETQ